jgi:hypothetical protein
MESGRTMGRGEEEMGRSEMKMDVLLANGQKGCQNGTVGEGERGTSSGFSVDLLLGTSRSTSPEQASRNAPSLFGCIIPPQSFCRKQMIRIDLTSIIIVDSLRQSARQSARQI